MPTNLAFLPKSKPPDKNFNAYLSSQLNRARLRDQKSRHSFRNHLCLRKSEEENYRHKKKANFLR